MGETSFWRKRIESFRHALEGLHFVVRTEQNARIHAVIAVLVVLAGFAADISRLEWLILIMTIVLVWAAEVFNTALEHLVNLVSPQRQPAAKFCKDISAAGVIVTVLGSIAVGLLIFGPPLWKLAARLLNF